MALMVRYCEKHRHAWPCSSPPRIITLGESKTSATGSTSSSLLRHEVCPVAPSLQAKSCPISSVDAIKQINELGGDLNGAEETAVEDRIAEADMGS